MDSIGKMYKQMLTEATGDDINRVAKHHPDVDRETIQKYADEADPKQGKGSRYIDWLVKGHKQGTHSTEDTFRLKAALDNFEKYKPKLEKKDIGQYKHVSELEDAVHPHLGVMSARAEGDAKTYWGKPEHHEKIFDDGAGLQVFHTKTAEASKAIYGGGHNAGGCHTSWCTAARSEHNRFDHYSDGGKNPLYQIHTPDGKVYQDEFSGDYSGGLRGANDTSVSRSDLVKAHPNLMHVPAFQGKDISYTAPGPKISEALHNEAKKGNYKTVLDHPAVETEHLHTILDNAHDSKYRMATLEHPKADASIVSRHADYEHLSGEEADKLINHPHFGEEHIQKILGHESYDNTKRALFNSDKLNRGHIEQAMNSDIYSSHALAAAHPLTTDEDRIKMISDQKAVHANFISLKSPDSISAVYKDGHKASVSDNQNSPSHVVEHAYHSSSGDYAKGLLAMHKNAPASVISDHIKNAGHESAIEVLKNQKSISSEHIKQAFDRPHMLIKQAAIRHASAPAEVHEEAMKNPSFHGSISVSKAASPDHLHELSKSEHSFIRQNVAENKNTSKETLSNLAADQDKDVATAAEKQLKKRK